MFDRNRKELWLNGTLNPILDASGRPEKIMLFAHFTTQEKEKLNEMNGVIQAVKQTLPVLEISTDFQCKSANEKFLKHFGVTRLKLREHKLCDFMPDKKFCEEFMNHKGELIQNQPFCQMLEFEVAGKREYWEVSFSMIRDLSGKDQHILMCRAVLGFCLRRQAQEGIYNKPIMDY